ncbi:monooxygenase [Sphingomonas oligophenolica]|uniref:FAD-dependent monooxygenase n=1 Tax=Sphingomonas oligophenolica TaxID=301154 RepID=A0ABU9YBP2_9SPHN
MCEFDADVVISGAGPSGLIVGAEAALGGAKVLILEKRNGPTWSRAGTLAPRVMEIFASRGIADVFVKRALELHSDPYSRDGIWAGLPRGSRANIDSDYPYVMMFPQLETERILAEHFRSLGGDIRLNSEVAGVEQDADGVTVTYNDEGGEKQVRGRYLVGADGNRSAVREAAGITRTGTPARRVAVNVDAFVENPYDKPLTVSHNENGWAMTYPLRNGVTRFAFIDAATMNETPDRPLELEDAKAMLRRVHGTDYGITKVDAINRFHDALYMADRIRDGRIFLVGESVRVHYPASGVGMNFCIQDGFNLGWKLAAAVTGRARDGLLDTYVTERIPEIKALLDQVQVQTAIQFGFDPEHIALKDFIEHQVLSSPDISRKISEYLSGLTAHYPSPEGSAEIVGQRLANLTVTNTAGGEANIFELLRGQDFLLIDLTGRAELPAVDPAMRLKVAAAETGDRAALAGLSTLLIRPDGHVAWASDRALDEHRPEAEIREWLNLTSDRPVLLASAATVAA